MGGKARLQTAEPGVKTGCVLPSSEQGCREGPKIPALISRVGLQELWAHQIPESQPDP